MCSSLRPFSLLLVEDDTETREMVSRMVAFKFPQCTIYTAEDGKEGLQLFKKHSPDLVVTDVNMPEMDGIEMATAIKAINPEASVLTARNEHIEEFKKIGYCAYLLKPLKFTALLEAIQDCHPEIRHNNKKPPEEIAPH
jgi:YesN/AraC family two-component response regulator